MRGKVTKLIRRTVLALPAPEGLSFRQQMSKYKAAWHRMNHKQKGAIHK